jgi:hypothetical protein
MKTTSLVSVMGVLASLALLACGDDGGEGRICVRGETQSCACPGGAIGAQECSADGRGWESCVCGWPDAGTDAGNDADVGGDTGGCPTPTLEQCQDPVWLETDECGMAEHQAMQLDAESTCHQMLLAEVDRLSAEDEEQEVWIPDELGGGTGMARVEPNPERRLSQVSMPLTYTGFAQQTACEATELGLSAEEQALREQWNANGNRVASCREYVFEKYYDYARFQDAVSARHDESRYVTEVAYGDSSDTRAIGTRSANGQRLRMRDGSEMDVQSPRGPVCYTVEDCASYGYPERELRNHFLAMPTQLFEWSEVATTADSTLHFYISNGRCYQSCGGPDYTPPWQWHMDRHAAALDAGFRDIQLDAMYPRVVAFDEALGDYARLRQVAPSCCPSSYENPPPRSSPCYPYHADCVSVVERLIDMFEEAYDDGCVVSPFERSITTVCDWSPAYFVDSLRDSFDAAMERDYQRCLDLTGDDLASLTHFAFIMPDGNPWADYQAQDYTVSASALDLYFSRHGEYRDALFDWYVNHLPRDLFNEQTGELRAPGYEWGTNLRNGNEGFGVYLNSLVRWGLTDFDPQGGQTQADLCLVGFEALGRLTLGGWAFWSNPVDILDAEVRLSLASGDGSGGHLYLLGIEIWDQDPVEEWLIAWSWSASQTLYENEKVIRIYGVPVGKLYGAVTGTLGLDVGAEVTGGREFDDLNHNGRVDPDESCSLDPNFHAWFTPWASLDVYGTWGPYVGIAEAGVRVDLMLVRLELPFTLDISLSSVPEEEGAVVFDVRVGADLVVRTLDGSISVYAVLGVCPLCKSVAKVLFAWSGLRWAWNLFEFDYPVPLGYLLEAMRFE